MSDEYGGTGGIGFCQRFGWWDDDVGHSRSSLPSFLPSCCPSFACGCVRGCVRAAARSLFHSFFCLFARSVKARIYHDCAKHQKCRPFGNLSARRRRRPKLCTRTKKSVRGYCIIITRIDWLLYSVILTVIRPTDNRDE